jgi:serine phosphatase RsbU (regulator of sigma subunit)/anti-sigma regulatory factor (Ser/Thr protein kinase)
MRRGVQSTSPQIADPAEQLRRLLRVADVALAHLSPEDLLDELLIRVREILDADTAAVLLLDKQTSELVATAAKGLEEEVEQGVRIPVGKGFAGRVAAERKPVVIGRVDHRNVLNPILREKGVCSLIGVPLLVRGEVLGVLHVGTLDYRAFTSADVELLQLVAERVALGLHVRLYEQERRMTETLQRTFLPESLPQVPGLRLTSKYLPATAPGIGGDWYDVFILPSGAVALAMGDVSGHGLHAAVVMGRVRNALRACTLEVEDPTEVVSRLDRLMATLDVTDIVTLLFGVVNAELSEFRFVSAGHLPPLLIKPDGNSSFVDEDWANPPLCVGPVEQFREQTVPLEASTSLLLYTDGLVERRDESLSEGLERLRGASALIHMAPNPAQAIESAIVSLLDGREPADDIALLLVDLETESSGVDLRMAANPAALVTVRRALRRWLSGLGVSRMVSDDVITAVGEAGANTVEHAYGPMGGWLQVLASCEGGTVRVIVSDGGRWRKRPSARGRGSTLMHSVMDSVELETTDAGTRVTMQRRLPAQ